MPDLAGLILGQIPRCTGQNISQITGGGGMGGFGIDLYINYKKVMQTQLENVSFSI